MRLIIAGSRTVDTIRAVESGLLCWSQAGNPFPSEIVSGGQHGWNADRKVHLGADYYGEQVAKHLDIPVRRFLPDWNTHGKAAGPIRNRQMAEYADGLLAIWDGESRGTANMIEEARKRGLRVLVHRFKQIEDDI